MMRLAAYFGKAYPSLHKTGYADLARRVLITSVYVGMILKGTKIPSDPIVVRMACALGLDPVRALRLARNDRADRDDPSIKKFLSGGGEETELVRVPELGSAWAGEPLWAEEHITAWHRVPREWTRAATCFMLRVHGDSMTGDGIRDGDHVLVARDLPVEEGAIVVARLNDEITVKRLRRNDRSWLLEPSNPDYGPIDVTDVEDFAVVGRVVWSGRQHE
jgi:SOS regulatory protein LexA